MQVSPSDVNQIAISVHTEDWQVSCSPCFYASTGQPNWLLILLESTDGLYRVNNYGHNPIGLHCCMLLHFQTNMKVYLCCIGNIIDCVHFWHDTCLLSSRHAVSPFDLRLGGFLQPQGVPTLPTSNLPPLSRSSRSSSTTTTTYWSIPVQCRPA